ncbi:MAG: hypothetical protein HY610_04860 [Elusimicrobia bacterium]|nr:hypothetical protein [Elusimicrobiota bacterium]
MADVELEKGKKKTNNKKSWVTTITAKKSKPKKEDYLIIDYPKEGETLAAGHYAIRIASSSTAETVEISIDGGLWQPCRQGAGYFWYDWKLIPAGAHKCAARQKLANGKYKTSSVVNCSVAEKTAPGPRFL